MVKRYSKSHPLIFEELEPRLLFSADIAEALVVDAVEQVYEEELVVVADLEPVAEPSAVVVHVPVEVEVEKAVSAESVTTEQEATLQPTEPSSVTIDLPVEEAVAAPTDQVTTEVEASALQTEEKDADTGLEQPSLDTVAESEITDSTTSTEIDTTVTESIEASPVTAIKELILINDNVNDVGQLVADIEQNDSPERSLEVVILNNKLDGIEQVTETLSEYKDLDAVHFITHGRDGHLSIGNDWIDSNDLLENSDKISNWGEALNEEGDILLYGCSIAPVRTGRILSTLWQNSPAPMSPPPTIRAALQL